MFPLYFLCLEFYYIGLLIVIIFLSLINSNKRNIKAFRFILKITILGLVILLFILLYLLNILDVDYYFCNSTFKQTKLILYLKIFVCLISLCIFISMLDYYNYENYLSFELIIIMLFSIEGMFLLFSANDFFFMYLAIELQSLSLYILASIKKYSNVSIEAGLKYFVYGSFASGLLLYGISLIYGYIGSTNFNQIYIYLWVGSFYEIPLGIFFGYSLILAGLLFKMGIAPFHYWVADVYEGSSTIITYFFSVLPKISIIYIFYISFSFALLPMKEIPNFSNIFIFIFICCAIISIFIGSVGALYQTKIKRLLAYSAIANLGYILLSLCSVSSLGIFASIYYFLIYILTLIQVFSILIVLRRYPYLNKLKNLVEFVSISHANFLLSCLLVFGLLSLAGIPPFVGFFGKFFVFLALIEKGNLILVLYALLFSVLTCVYYIRLIRFIWFVDRGIQPIFSLLFLTQKQALLISLISIINIFLFFFQGPLILLIQELVLDSIFLNNLTIIWFY